MYLLHRVTVLRPVGASGAAIRLARDADAAVHLLDRVIVLRRQAWLLQVMQKSTMTVILCSDCLRLKRGKRQHG
jgi:hypothetical protein